MLNKQNGNMYPWVTHTWNPIKGKCFHDCSYCYMKRFKRPQPPVRIDEKELKTDLGSGNKIFVGSSCDMWASDIPENWIEKIMEKCLAHDNTYVFQTKNPDRYREVFEDSIISLRDRFLLGVTIETNRYYSDYMGKAPYPCDRLFPLHFVSVEPIMDFDMDILVDGMRYINPEFVSIGADSKGHKLPEPEPGKIKDLIAGLSKFTEVKLKPNLKRIFVEAKP